MSFSLHISLVSHYLYSYTTTLAYYYYTQLMYLEMLARAQTRGTMQ